MLSVVVRNTTDRTLRSAEAVVTARDRNDVLISSSLEAPDGGCCAVTELPPGQEFGFYVDIGDAAADISRVDVAYRDVPWAPAADTSPTPLVGHAGPARRQRRAGAVVVADVTSPWADGPAGERAGVPDRPGRRVPRGRVRPVVLLLEGRPRDPDAAPAPGPARHDDRPGPHPSDRRRPGRHGAELRRPAQAGRDPSHERCLRPPRSASTRRTGPSATGWPPSPSLLPAEVDGPVVLALSDELAPHLQAAFPGALVLTDGDPCRRAGPTRRASSGGTASTRRWRPGRRASSSSTAGGTTRPRCRRWPPTDGVVAVLGDSRPVRSSIPSAESPELVWRRSWPVHMPSGPVPWVRRWLGLSVGRGAAVPRLHVSGDRPTLADDVLQRPGPRDRCSTASWSG